MLLVAGGVGIALLQHGGNGTEGIFQRQLQLAGVQHLVALGGEIGLLGCARLQAVGKVVRQLAEEVHLFVGERAGLFTVNEQAAMPAGMPLQRQQQTGAQGGRVVHQRAGQGFVARRPGADGLMQGGIRVSQSSLANQTALPACASTCRVCWSLFSCSTVTRESVVEGNGVADLLQQGLLIILLEHGVVGAVDGLQGPGVLLQPLLLLFLLGDVVEEDADPDHLAQLVVQRKLGGAEPAGLAPFR